MVPDILARGYEETENADGEEPFAVERNPRMQGPHGSPAGDRESPGERIEEGMTAEVHTA